MYKIGIIGAGIIANTHINAIKEIASLQVAAVVDVNEEKAKSAAAKCECPYYLDYKKIDVSLDAVIINLPHFLHAEVSCYFLEQGIHVLVEKPMANTYEECEKMMASAKKGNTKLAVGHVQRFFGANDVVKRFYEEKTFGALAMTNERRNIYYFDSSRPRWFLSKKQAGGGILMNYGAHALDKLFYIIGKPIIEINSNCSNLLNNYDIEGHAQVFIKFDGGISSVMTFSGYHSFKALEVIYYFTDAAVRVNSDYTVDIARNGEFEPYDFKETQTPFVKQLTEFCNLLDGKESRIATAEYSADIIKTIEKIYKGI